MVEVVPRIQQREALERAGVEVSAVGGTLALKQWVPLLKAVLVVEAVRAPLMVRLVSPEKLLSTTKEDIMSNTYISPSGNSEIWNEKPAGYYTPEEWEEMNRPAPPEPPTLEEALTTKLGEIMAGYSAAFAPVKAMYPDEEREGWPEQKEEARSYLSDPTVETPVLAELVRQRAAGETIAEFARLVLGNSAVWTAVYGRLTGQQQRMCREVLYLAEVDGITAEDILSYPVSYSLPEGM